MRLKLSLNSLLSSIGLVFLTVSFTSCNSTLQELAKQGGQILGSQAQPTQNEMITAIKQALSNGVKTATNTLGQTNGFQNNPEVRIPLPNQLTNAANVLRQLGQGQLVDEFELTMNRAAEQAVPKAVNVFMNSISKMSVQDALAIVSGDNPQAATDYFKRTSTDQLHQEFLPIVKKATLDTGVTSTYKLAVEKAGVLASFIDPNLKDIDQYITNQATDALFVYIAKEEEKIRKDPISRTTDILQKVFGYYQK